MRVLLYVPIIHEEADLGSLGASLAQKSASLFGERLWAEHKATVSLFWSKVADYLLSQDATKLKIYQDGLAAQGDVGREVVRQAAERGSLNHRLLWQLVSKGAELRKTEDIRLLAQELKLAHEGLSLSQLPNPELKAEEKRRLTQERDKFIAETIDSTLRPGEIGVLFMGAYHDVPHYLPGDVVVKPLKERNKVMAYFQVLFSGGGGREFQCLANHLIAPIELRV